MKMLPIHNQPALLIEWRERILVVGDTHIGIEDEVRERGVNIRSQTNTMLTAILELCKEYGAERLIHLGDVKHNIPMSRKQEWHEVPIFFKELLTLVSKIDIIPGNHDGNLRRMLPEGVRLHPSDGLKLEGLDVGFVHGHTWPAPHVMKSNRIVMGHNHPMILFSDALGARRNESCWLRARSSADWAERRFTSRKVLGYGGDSEFIIMPAFNSVCSGKPVNVCNTKLLGPLMRSRLINVEDADIYLLDGTYLGKLDALRWER